MFNLNFSILGKKKNSHDDLLKIPEPTIIKEKVNSFLPYAVDVLNEELPCTYDKMLPDGTIIPYDDYASVLNDDTLFQTPDSQGRNQMDYRKHLMETHKYENVEQVGGPSGSAYTNTGVVSPEMIHRSNKARTQQALRKGTMSEKRINSFWGDTV